MSFPNNSGNSLRPIRLADMVGQSDSLDRIKILIGGAKSRNEPLCHTLFEGNPGVGKTTIATAIANEMGCDIQVANGGNIRSIKALLPYIARVKKGSILFIDEIHRLTKMVEEFLYPIIEDFRMDLGDKGGDGVSVPVERFTFIGATTESGSIAKPLYDRFVHHEQLTLYSDSEIAVLVKKNAIKLNLDITPEALNEIAKRSRGTPRVANNRLYWTRDYCQSLDAKVIDDNLVIQAMTKIGIDPSGMDANDRIYLETLKVQFGGGPAGLNTMESATNIASETITGVIEPFLIRKKLIVKTPKGRVAI